jgi:hypothetical protein
VSRVVLLHFFSLQPMHAIRYTLCTAMQKRFTAAVMPALGLRDDPAKDSKRARLERCIEDVSDAMV